MLYYDNFEIFTDKKSRALHSNTKQENIRNDFFCDTNQSKPTIDTAVETVIDSEVHKNVDSENETSGNVKFDNVISSP